MRWPKSKLTKPSEATGRVTRNVHRLAENYREVRRAVGPGVAIVSVIKGHAYGHGAAEVARTLAAACALYPARMRRTRSSRPLGVNRAF